MSSAVAALATFVMAFWLIGDQSTVGPASDPDYVWHPRTSATTERWAGVGAGIALIVALVMLRVIGPSLASFV